MTTASGSLRRASGRPIAASTPRLARSRRRRIAGLVVVFVALLVLWEARQVAGRRPVADPRHHRRAADRLRARPAVRVADRRRPVAAARLGHRRARSSTRPSAAARRSAAVLAGQAAFTFAEAFAGFVLGGLLGLALGILFVHSRLAERALVPYVVASQTVPILAIAPLVVVAIKADWLSVMAVAAYLTFFPVTIASLRGLRAADPRAFELFRSYAASRRQILWQLRLPTSVPYLFAGFRVAAAASIIGAIIGELPAGVSSRPRQRDPQLQPVLHHRRPSGCGRRSSMCTVARACSSSAPSARRGHRHARPLPAGGGPAVTDRSDVRASAPGSDAGPATPRVDATPVVQATGVGKVFGTGPTQVTALEAIDLTIRPGRVRLAHRARRAAASRRCCGSSAT